MRKVPDGLLMLLCACTSPLLTIWQGMHVKGIHLLLPTPTMLTLASALVACLLKH